MLKKIINFLNIVLLFVISGALAIAGFFYYKLLQEKQKENQKIINYEQEFKDYKNLSDLILNHIEKYSVVKLTNPKIKKVTSYRLKKYDTYNTICVYTVTDNSKGFLVRVAFRKDKAKVYDLSNVFEVEGGTKWV